MQIIPTNLAICNFDLACTFPKTKIHFLFPEIRIAFVTEKSWQFARCNIPSGCRTRGAIFSQEKWSIKHGCRAAVGQAGLGEKGDTGCRNSNARRENRRTPVVQRNMCAVSRIVAGRFNRGVSARNSYIIAGIPRPYRVTCAGLYEDLCFCFLTTGRSIRPGSSCSPLLTDRTILGNSTGFCN